MKLLCKLGLHTYETACIWQEFSHESGMKRMVKRICRTCRKVQRKKIRKIL